MLGNHPLAKASAGDTIEIMEVVKGDGKKRGGIRVRASARFVEAYAKTKDRRNGNSLDYTPCRNSSRAGDDRQMGTPVYKSQGELSSRSGELSSRFQS